MIFHFSALIISVNQNNIKKHINMNQNTKWYIHTSLRIGHKNWIFRTERVSKKLFNPIHSFYR